MTGPDRLLATARDEIGYLEKKSNDQLDDKTANAGKNNYTKYARDLDGRGNIYNGKKNGYNWCDVFCDWCFIHTFGEELGMKLTCQSYKGLGAGVKYSANYYKQKGQFFTKNPQPGDQIFFYGTTGGKVDKAKWQHTGLVDEVKSGKVYTIEGNTSVSSGVVANGGGVARKSYSLTYSRIAGYGRPDWSLVQEEDDDMLTYEQWKEYMEQYRKEHQDNDSSSYSEVARQWGVNSKIVNGSGKVDGEDNYMWQDFCTREQFLTMLYRFAEQRGLD